MRRMYTARLFEEMAFKLRERIPDFNLTTDIIVGFPAESDEDFADTMDVLERVRFEQLFSFKYSPRPLTPAAEYQNQVDPAVASERLSILQARHTQILDEIMDAQLGSIHQVYFDELKPNGRVAGRSDDGKLVFVEGSEELLSQIVPVKITKTSRGALDGVVVDTP